MILWLVGIFGVLAFIVLFFEVAQAIFTDPGRTMTILKETYTGLSYVVVVFVLGLIAVAVSLTLVALFLQMVIGGVSSIVG